MYVSCDYNDNWNVWFSGTVVVSYGGDPWGVGGSDIRSEAPSRDTLIRDSIQNHCAWETFKEIFLIHYRDIR
jgi:hypothetical protein